MEFLNPQYIWLLILIPVSWILSLLGDEKRRAGSKNLNLAAPSKEALVTKLIVNSLFIALLVIAIARPYSGFDEIKKERIGADNLILLDISDSMRAKDASPSRLEVAKRKVWDLASILKENSSGDRIGLILFAGQAYLYCPPTVDFAALKQFLSHIKPELISAQGSGINLALNTALDVIKRTKMKSPRLFIFTDGEDKGFSESEGVMTLKNGGLTPRILGIGTVAGSPLEIPGQGYIKDSADKIVISKLNRETLSKLAAEAEGIYTNSTVGDSDLKLLLSARDSAGASTNERGTSSVRIYNEFGHILIWIALLILVLGSLNKKLLPLTLLLVSTYTDQAKAEPNTYEAWQAYKNQNYEDAKAGFESALKKSPESAELLQSLGSTHYKLDEFADAERLFLALIDNAKSKEQRFNGYFNLGNSRLKQQNLEGAISSYEDALRIRPDDEAAKFNLEYAKKLREEKQQNKEQSQDKNQQDKSEPQDKEQQDQEQSSEDQNRNESSPEQTEDPSEAKDSNKNRTESDKEQGAPKSNPESDKESGQESNRQDAESNAPTEQELADQEARRWLDSLPDSPIQIRKDNRRLRTQNGQTW